MALQILGRISKVEVVTNWLDRAQEIGKVHVDGDSIGGGCQVRIDTGRWGLVSAMFFGKGPTIEEAARKAVDRAESFGDLLPPHPNDC